MRFDLFFITSAVLWLNITVVLFYRTLFATADTKLYSRLRMYNDSLRKVYFHETLVITVEREKDSGKLLSCEITDAENDRENFIKSLDDDLAKDVTECTFDEIWNLSTECWDCNEFVYLTVDDTAENIARKMELSPSFYDAMDGIVPGTFWCGAGSLARHYFDLGAERDIDRCCRRHDVCPVKVLASQNKYNLFNDSKYTKSHCKCDEEFSKCLKDTGKKRAKYVGELYFNLAEMECLADDNGERLFRPALKFEF